MCSMLKQKQNVKHCTLVDIHSERKKKKTYDDMNYLNTRFHSSHCYRLPTVDGYVIIIPSIT